MSGAGALHMFSALDGSWMSVPGLEGPCADAMWDAQHPNVFLTHDEKQRSTFVLEASALDGPGTRYPLLAVNVFACMHVTIYFLQIAP